MSSGETFDGVMIRLRGGDNDAAAEVFRRFAGRLVGLARVKLGGQVKAKVDPEDVLQSVFRSFFTRHAEGQFEIDGWDSLWAMLTVITVRKCSNRRAHYRAARRSVDREAGGPPAGDEPSPVGGWDAFARDPAPDEVAAVAETVETLLRGLDERDRSILVLRLQGHEVREIGDQVGCAERTVRRVLEYARRRLQELGQEDG